MHRGKLLAAEGFTDVQYIESPEGARGVFDRRGSGAVDMSQWYVPPAIVDIDTASPQKILEQGTTWRFFDERSRS